MFVNNLTIMCKLMNLFYHIFTSKVLLFKLFFENIDILMSYNRIYLNIHLNILIYNDFLVKKSKLHLSNLLFHLYLINYY
ncbi:MAG: hypothetical protein ACJAX4_001367 [Clostridium sp.]|jgi:hypothetical protein